MIGLADSLLQPQIALGRNGKKSTLFAAQKQLGVPCLSMIFEMLALHSTLGANLILS